LDWVLTRRARRLEELERAVEQVILIAPAGDQRDYVENVGRNVPVICRE
jgi:hypothetical protein